ncbi:TPA: cytidine deaminase, partial [Pasteurella multocida]|nr:cytidine deaminase [Pasteurella multocida]
VIDSLKSRLEIFEYDTEIIKISSILPPFSDSKKGEYQRVRYYMIQGDKFREKSGNNSILAAGAISLIKKYRKEEHKKRAYIIDSLKHPEEVELLRKVYGNGFYLFGIHADKERRMDFLINEKGCNPEAANELIRIDENENINHGQKTRDTYHLSDFFLNLGNNSDHVKNTLQRFLELIFSNQYLNPTFDEFAMFMAFNSSVRSGDLSRQVGAVISKNKQIISTGVNDVPSFGGGLYWALADYKTGKVNDVENGKDYKKGIDSNKQTQIEIIQEILREAEHIDLNKKQKEKLENILRNSRISDLTEFGRVVHAEMEAILACGREGISTVNSTLYCTTFPCHNCAKHIIASGINRVVYVEPYPKSKALEFHSESIELRSSFDDSENSQEKVIFEPFIGVGPRRFLDLFSMNLGIGSKLKRKQKNGAILFWDKDSASIRTPLINNSYLELEEQAISIWENEKMGNDKK